MFMNLGNKKLIQENPVDNTPKNVNTTRFSQFQVIVINRYR